MSEYSLVIMPLPEEEGGGFLAAYPDLPGCLSDGETREEALENAKDAFNAWMTVQRERGVEIPEPGSSAQAVRQKIDKLMSVIKTLADYNELAEGRIEDLEAQLEMAVKQLSRDWTGSSALIAHVGLRQSRSRQRAH